MAPMVQGIVEKHDPMEQSLAEANKAGGSGDEGLLGIYTASVGCIAVFMRWPSRFAWRAIGSVSVAVPVAFFLLFEIWFPVPLPEGPLEELLGY